MFRWMPMCVAFLALLVAGAASAQLDGEPLLRDPTHDVVMSVAETVQEPTDRAAALDLVHLWMDEDPDGFWFRVEVRDTSGSSEAPVFESGNIYMQFTHHDRTYRVLIVRNFFVDAFTWGYVQQHDVAEDRWSNLRFLDVTTEGNHLTTYVPREILRDGGGAAPFPGRALTDIHVYASTTHFGFLCFRGDCTVPFSFTDQMPDAGDHASWEVLHGIQQTGHARLASQVPLRASNGEATTFVFEVNASNEGNNRDRFTFAIKGAPAIWDVRVPVPLVELEAGTNATVPILVTMPFNHQHGLTQTFLVEMTSQNDPRAVGRVELGVHFLEVPQPTGHHPELFLHSGRWEGNSFSDLFGTVFPGSTWAYMNAQSDFPLSAGVPVPGSLGDFIGTIDGTTYATVWRWNVPLTPGLQIGMDFDLDRNGHIILPFQTDVPLVEADLYVRLVHMSSRDGVEWQSQPLFADVMPIGTVGAGARFDYEAEMAINPAADYLPFQPYQGLTLQVQIGSLRPGVVFAQAAAPVLLPGGTMLLPLNEYSDPVSDTFAALADLSLAPEGPQERFVNPGKTVILRAKLQNDMDHHMAMNLDLTGVNAEWARIIGSPLAHMDAGKHRIIEVAVQVPADAIHGQRADLILTATAQGDDAMRTLVRLVAHVDTQNDRPDEADLLPAEAERRAPGVGMVGLLVLVAAVAVVAARRRV